MLEQSTQLSCLLAAQPPRDWKLKNAQLSQWYTALNEHLPPFLFAYLTRDMRACTKRYPGIFLFLNHPPLPLHVSLQYTCTRSIVRRLQYPLGFQAESKLTCSVPNRSLSALPAVYFCSILMLWPGGGFVWRWLEDIFQGLFLYWLALLSSAVPVTGQIVRR